MTKVMMLAMFEVEEGNDISAALGGAAQAVRETIRDHSGKKPDALLWSDKKRPLLEAMPDVTERVKRYSEGIADA